MIVSCQIAERREDVAPDEVWTWRVVLHKGKPIRPANTSMKEIALLLKLAHRVAARIVLDPLRRVRLWIEQFFANLFLGPHVE
jgi:hypothetical protein